MSKAYKGYILLMLGSQLRRGNTKKIHKKQINEQFWNLTTKHFQYYKSQFWKQKISMCRCVKRHKVEIKTWRILTILWQK